MKQYPAMVMAVGLFARMAAGDVWQDLAKYEYGKGRAAEEADHLLQKTPVAGYGAIEDSLIQLVRSNEATPDGKSCACRLLQRIGTGKCIPAVAGLLNDEGLSHYARLVLERLQSAKADAAMRLALDDAPDQVKIGILGSLGARRDRQSVATIAELAVHRDRAVASAAIGALGRIGGEPAARCLRNLKPAAELEPMYMTALVDCGQSLKGSAATDLYMKVLAGTSMQRIGALKGLLAVDEKKAAAFMVDALKGDDAQLSGGVLTLICGEQSGKLTTAMAELLPALPDEKKLWLIPALGARGDRAAEASLADCISSANPSVSAAAVMAVAKLGDSGMVRILLGVKDGCNAIAGMSAGGVDDALVKALEEENLKIPAIKALVARNYFPATSSLLHLVDDNNPEVRKAAWDGLRSIGTEDLMEKMAGAVFAIKDPGEAEYALAACRHICVYARDKARCFDVIAGYYEGTFKPLKRVTVELAPMVGSPSALNLVKTALKEGDKELYDKAVRSLAAWCNESAAEELLELAKNTPEEVDRIVALCGYIRIASQRDLQLSQQQRTEMFKKAAELATRSEEKKQIISGLGIAPGEVTIGIVNQYLDDPSVKDEADLCAAGIAESLCKDGPADLVRALANKLLASRNSSIVERAKRVLDNIGK